MSGAMCSSTALNGTMYLGDTNCHIFSEKFLRGYALYALPPVSPGVPLRDYIHICAYVPCVASMLHPLRH